MDGLCTNYDASELVEWAFEGGFDPFLDPDFLPAEFEKYGDETLREMSNTDSTASSPSQSVSPAMDGLMSAGELQQEAPAASSVSQPLTYRAPEQLPSVTFPEEDFGERETVDSVPGLSASVAGLTKEMLSRPCSSVCSPTMARAPSFSRQAPTCGAPLQPIRFAFPHAGCRKSRVLCDRCFPCRRCVRLGRDCIEPGAVKRGRPSRKTLAER